MAVYLVDLTLFLLTAELSYAFNVYVPSAIVHEGPKGSYFGFDVDHHVEQDRSWLLVGAPKANTSQRNVVEGGQVYKCEAVSQERPGESGCQPVTLDDTGNDGVSYANNILGKNGSFMPNEEKSYQWLGASISSQDGIIVACAPRYVYFTSNLRRREPVGTCWFKKPGEGFARDISPCRDGSASMIPRWGYHKTGFCQAGFSATLSSNSQQIVMGAVGSHYWQGQVFRQNISDLSFNGLQRTGERPYKYDGAYLGYALIAADLNGDGIDEFAVSLPKGGELTGMVSIFSNNLMPLLNVSGEQLGEYFGYSLASSDLNGDGLADLIVGAPFYAENKALYESGRVFVFYQDRMTRNINPARKTIIEGSKKSGARFGTSVAGLKDINGDSYQDIVVGAPYDGDQRTGAVYIFHGSSTGVRAKASQVIFANEIDIRLKAFGFSVAGGNDLDRNEYPDIIVGAYASDSAVYIKSRPIAQVSVEMIVSPNIVKLEDKTCLLTDGTPVSCFNVTVCISYGGRGVPDAIELATNLTLDSQKSTGQHRAFYMNMINTIHLSNITLYKGRENCSKHNVYFKSNLVDKLNPVDIQLEYELINLNRFKLPSILDSYTPTKIQTQAEIGKNCGSDNKCIPDLSVVVKSKSTEHFVGDSTEIRLDVTVRNHGEDAYEALVSLPLPPGVSYVSFSNKNDQSNVRCGTQENEVGESVVCNIGNPFLAEQTAKFYLRLDPVKVNGSDHFLEFDFLANSSNKENNTDMKNNYFRKTLNVKVKTELSMTGVSYPEQILFNASTYERPFYFSDVGPEVKHIYTVRNFGPSSITAIEVNILWPSLLDDHFELLYLTKIPVVTEGSGKCLVHAEINKHDLKRGTRNQTEQTQGRKINAVSSSPSFREIKCPSKSKSCISIVCSLGPMAREDSAKIEIISRFWIDSFNKSGITSAFIHSKAIAQVMTVPYSIKPEEYSVATFQIKTYAGDRNAGIEKKRVVWWVIALAIGLGFIVLLCLIMALYKCGFFKRIKHGKDKEKNGSPPQNGNTSKHSSPPLKQTPSHNSSKHSSPSIKYDAIPSSEY